MTTNEPVDRWAIVAQDVTVGAALLTLVVWVSTLTLFGSAEWSQMLLVLLTGIMIVGGVAMGVLYVARIGRQR